MAKLPEADIKKVTWSTDVYEPSDDSFALVDAVNEWLQASGHKDLPKFCLEVGCGSGYVICSVALALRQLISTQQQQQQYACTAQGDSSSSQVEAPTGTTAGPSCSFFATDINPAALAATAKTLAAHEVHGVELVQTDLVSSLLRQLAGAVDLLLFNPPYVPTPDEEVLRDGIARAWAGGHLGRRVTDRLLALLPQLLSPKGHAFIVTVIENKPEEIMNMLQEAGFTVSIALTRGADEECLKILHVERPPLV